MRCVNLQGTAERHKRKNLIMEFVIIDADNQRILFMILMTC